MGMIAGAVLGPSALDHLMPMHLSVSAAGVITSAGPTLRKVMAPTRVVGTAFFDLFEIRRPGGILSVADVIGHQGARLFLVRQGTSVSSLRGVAVAAGDGTALLNLSFGISLAEAVSRHQLTDSDFAPTDLAVEMLYLLEAKNAVMDELQSLNTRLDEARQRAETQALTDTLTGLGNRRAMDRRMARHIAAAEGFGVMHVDLDLFKQVNDTHGHAAGDHVLAHVGRVLRENCRRTDLVARIGGDEFVLILAGLTDPDRLSAIGRRIIDQLAQPIPWQGRECRVSASIGVNLSLAGDGADAATILRDADRALYAAKSAGRGRVVLHQP
jgi:diguanylate cyclase (GGDEF)-like protein